MTAYYTAALYIVEVPKELDNSLFLSACTYIITCVS